MKKELLVVFLIVILVQGCATLGDKKTASAPMVQGCEVFCESNRTLEDCERESQDFFGFSCRAVKDPEWAKERFPMKDPGGNPTAMDIMKSRIGASTTQGYWIIRKK